MSVLIYMSVFRQITRWTNSYRLHGIDIGGRLQDRRLRNASHTVDTETGRRCNYMVEYTIEVPERVKVSLRFPIYMDELTSCVLLIPASKGVALIIDVKNKGSASRVIFVLNGLVCRSWSKSPFANPCYRRENTSVKYHTGTYCALRSYVTYLLTIELDHPSWPTKSQKDHPSKLSTHQNVSLINLLDVCKQMKCIQTY
jgi:hypothetical protein